MTLNISEPVQYLIDRAVASVNSDENPKADITELCKLIETEAWDDIVNGWGGEVAFGLKRIASQDFDDQTASEFLNSIRSMI